MPPKRRILVAFEANTFEELTKRKKIAVSKSTSFQVFSWLFYPSVKISIDEKATIADLAQEVAGTIGEEKVKLEVGDGFELRSQE